MLSGIYAIRNKQTGNIYVGQSKDIPRRWESHIHHLNHRSHHCSALQSDWSDTDPSTFTFEILECVDCVEKLTSAEIKWFNSFDRHLLYNTYEVRQDCVAADDASFVAYINNKWLVPIGTDKRNLSRYKIWRDEDKDEIVRQAISAKLFKLFPCDVTFLRVVRLLENALGYTVETKQGVVEDGRMTYRLIISYDEAKATYEPAIETIAE